MCGSVYLKLEEKTEIAATGGSSSAEKMETAQLVKRSLCKHDDLSLLPGTHTKNKLGMHVPVIQALGRQKRVDGTASLVNWPSLIWEYYINEESLY